MKRIAVALLVSALSCTGLALAQEGAMMKEDAMKKHVAMHSDSTKAAGKKHDKMMKDKKMMKEKTMKSTDADSTKMMKGKKHHDKHMKGE